MLFDRLRVNVSLVLAVIVASFATVAVATAQSHCGSGGSGLSLDRRLNVKEGGYRGVGNVCDQLTDGFTTTLQQDTVRAPDSVTTQAPQRPNGPGASWTPNLGANPLDLIRTFCRRDDWAFLPAGSNGGLPCTTTTRGASVDPGAVARELFGALSLPS